MKCSLVYFYMTSIILFFFFILPSAATEAVQWLFLCSVRHKLCFLFTFTALPPSSTHRFAEFAIIAKGFLTIFNDSLDLIRAEVVIHSPESNGFKVILKLFLVLVVELTLIL